MLKCPRGNRTGVIKQFDNVLQERYDFRVMPFLFHQFIHRDKAHEIIADDAIIKVDTDG